MKGRWVKRGRIYEAHGRFAWNRSHAAVPTVDAGADDVWRIYYAARDADNRSRVSYIDVAGDDPGRVRYEHPEPILPLGAPGTFDDCGIMPSWVTAPDGDTRYLYYIGWTTRQTVPYSNAVGLAISRDGGRTFAKAGAGPLFGPTLGEPYFTGTSCVLIDDGVWKNWYLSCVGWGPFEGRMEPFYHLKYAESADGVHWDRAGRVAVELRPGEAGIAKASVVRDAAGYRMWYSVRGRTGYRTGSPDSYRIGYAESADGREWERLDHRAGIGRSEAGWDAEMIAYPHVVRRGEGLVMFYNGNGFGKTGIGFAVWEGGS